MKSLMVIRTYHISNCVSSELGLKRFLQMNVLGKMEETTLFLWQMFFPVMRPTLCTWVTFHRLRLILHGSSPLQHATKSYWYVDYYSFFFLILFKVAMKLYIFLIEKDFNTANCPSLYINN